MSDRPNPVALTMPTVAYGKRLAMSVPSCQDSRSFIRLAGKRSEQFDSTVFLNCWTSAVRWRFDTVAGPNMRSHALQTQRKNLASKKAPLKARILKWLGKLAVCWR